MFFEEINVIINEFEEINVIINKVAGVRSSMHLRTKGVIAQKYYISRILCSHVTCAEKYLVYRTTFHWDCFIANWCVVCPNEVQMDIFHCMFKPVI